jgi:hypothetical protein
MVHQLRLLASEGVKFGNSDIRGLVATVRETTRDVDAGIPSLHEVLPLSLVLAVAGAQLKAFPGFQISRFPAFLPSSHLLIFHITSSRLHLHSSPVIRSLDSPTLASASLYSRNAYLKEISATQTPQMTSLSPCPRRPPLAANHASLDGYRFDLPAGFKLLLPLKRSSEDSQMQVAPTTNLTTPTSYQQH